MYENVVGRIWFWFKSCAFQCENPTEGKLHIVQIDDMGKRFIDIKERTSDSRIRTCLSLLQVPGDAAAHELWYHRDCLQKVERQCDLVNHGNPYVGKMLLVNVGSMMTVLDNVKDGILHRDDKG